LTPQDEYLSRQRLLIIAPHADDECFGCAGTMARIKRLGGEVYVLVCSVGDLKHYNGTGGIVAGSTRAEELAQVMEFLRVDDWDILYRDAETHLRLDMIPRRELIAKFERESKLALDRLKPTILAIPTSSYNQDHEAVFRAAFTAARRCFGVSNARSFIRISTWTFRISWRTNCAHCRCTARKCASRCTTRACKTSNTSPGSVAARCPWTPRKRTWSFVMCCNVVFDGFAPSLGPNNGFPAAAIAARSLLAMAQKETPPAHRGMGRSCCAQGRPLKRSSKGSNGH